MTTKTIRADMLDEFELQLKNEERSAATIEKYMRDVRQFAQFIADGDVCKQSVSAYKSKLGDSYAVTSANSMIAALNRFLRFCGWSDLCVRQFRVQRQPYCSEEKELTRAEYFRLIDTAEKKQNQRLSLIIQTICSTGIRVSELCYITVEALQKGEAVVNCKGKVRRIFLVLALKKKLLRYVKEQNIKSGAVFITQNRNPISRNRIWKEMKSLCEAAKVAPSKVFPHNLRHLFARVFYALEKDIAKLADILGHASINTTRIYIVTTGSEHKKRMERMHLIL